MDSEYAHTGDVIEALIEHCQTYLVTYTEVASATHIPLHYLIRVTAGDIEPTTLMVARIESWLASERRAPTIPAHC